MHIARWQRLVAMGAVVGLGLTACGGGETTDEPSGSETPSGSEAPMEITMGPGVTAEPCPEAVNPDNGCIYLGIISDLSDGPFSPLGVPLTQAQEAFWAKVNAEGGVGGAFDVDVTTYQEDAKYNAANHAESYAKIRENIAAMAQSLGTSQTLGVIDDMDTDNMVAVPATWWSGWAFNDLILQTGSSYCVDAMNAIDWVQGGDAPLSTLAIVGFPGDYGGDWAVGVKAAAEANNIEVVAEITQIPVIAGGDVAATVGEIVQKAPDAVFLATGPTELGQIAGGAAQNGYTGRFLGAAPTWNAALLASAAGELLQATYNVAAPYAGAQGDSAAHQDFLAAVPEPANDGATFGWMQSYALLDVLETAYAAGDLSRAGIRAAVAMTTTEPDGAAASINYGAASADQAIRSSVIGKPDPEQITGLATVVAEQAGATAASYDLSAPCFAPEG